MKKVILIFVTIVLSGLLYAKDNKSTDALLREIADVFSMNTGLIIWIRLLSMPNGKRNWHIV